MSTLSNFHANDSTKDEAWRQSTMVLGALTIVAVIAIMVFASTG